MSQVIPEELVSLYGTMAISRIATAKTKANLEAMPDLQEALKKFGNDPAPTKQISINDLDVENGGMDEEFEDFMTSGFEQLIPGFGGLRPRPFPVPVIPPQVVLCARVLRALAELREERDVQQESAERLRALVAALSKNAHPIIQIFAALFKVALAEVEERLAEIDRLINGLLRTGWSNDCFT